MRHIIMAATFIAMVVSPSQASIVAQYSIAESLNSRELYDEWRKPERHDFCLGVITGVISAIATSQLKVNFHPFCLGMDQRSEPLIDIVLKYLEETPQALGSPASIHIAKALEHAFPCEPLEFSGDLSHVAVAFPVDSLNWLMGDPADPVFLFGSVPDLFPLEDNGTGREGLFVERYGMGLQGYKTYAARVQLLLKDSTLLTVEGQVRVVGERTAAEAQIVPLMVAVGIKPGVNLEEVQFLTVDQLH